ncbi:MAG: glycosyltransferase family 2 protein [Limnobacter sp.]|uniref:glycosyltransferase family 2 protein n=1 Tax=Limnobacter sp. TaxID=2003368 RepID=UPI0022C4C94B|nr:glycosyltransferase family 2 protein [Limnobacter sp.]MCZ8016515.1 glycosyltransferase family 2 protein [Limnobacter sp.]
MKISIITAVYNRATTLTNSIDSVQSQSYGNTEHVLVDGASSDGSVELIQERLRSQDLFVSERDKGIYDALNKGLKMATGDVIGLVHSDDYLADSHVLRDVAHALSQPGVDGVYGDLQYVSKDDTSKVIRHWESGEYHISKLKRGWMPPHPTLFLKREVIEQWGGYDTNLRIAADYDAMLRYLQKGKIQLAYVPRVLVKMRVGGESNQSLKKIIQKSREDIVALRNNGVGGFGTLIFKNLSKVKQFF